MISTGAQRRTEEPSNTTLPGRLRTQTKDKVVPARMSNTLLRRNSSKQGLQNLMKYVVFVSL